MKSKTLQCRLFLIFIYKADAPESADKKRKKKGRIASDEESKSSRKRQKSTFEL